MSMFKPKKADRKGYIEEGLKDLSPGLKEHAKKSILGKDEKT
ncbi:hypothetical protein ACSU1N_05855 [Thermogladius sp. 4427co]